MFNPVKSLGFMECYSSSSSRDIKIIKISSSSIRYRRQKICRPKTVLEVRKFGDGSLLLLQERRDCIENVEHNYPILIDLSKGFDTTNCDLLLKI